MDLNKPGMSLEEAKNWMKDKYCLAVSVVRLDRQLPKPMREIPHYISEASKKTAHQRRKKNA
jgi:hypothetical protein